MPIEHWLRDLRQHDSSFIDGDLDILAGLSYPFLSGQCSSNQIERLSGHLGDLRCGVRRNVIAYSLYIRQLDVILDAGPRATCARACPRPPVGCCGFNHHVVLGMSDIMRAQGSPTSLHMSHVIGQLQRLEAAHSVGQGRRLQTGYCSCLAEDGCTLRLFKSPRCAHYLCEGLEQVMGDEHGQDAEPFLGAMRFAFRTAVCAPEDFTSPLVIRTGALLFPASLA
jgi:hypothetical protein